VKRRSDKERKKLVDDAYLLRQWQAWHREQLEEALDGVHRNVMERLMAQLKDLRSARELVAFIEAQDWSAVDADTRLIALHQINTAIMQLRERSDQAPIDDALWHEPPRAFQLIRDIINPVSRTSGEAHRGQSVNQTEER
jgi:hypothetical protein